MLLAEITSNEWGILIGIVVTIALPSFASWVVVIVKLGKIESGQQFYSNKLTELTAEHRELWTSFGKHEERIDQHDALLGRIIDKMQMPPQENR